MNPKLEVQIISARNSDAARLSAFAEQTFRDTYGPYNTPERVALYVEENFGETLQRAQLREENRITLIGELSGKIIAYSSLRKSDAPDCVRGSNVLNLERFYVGQEYFGKGIARKLMTATVGAAAEVGVSSVWLSVWKENSRAVAYYRKSGFEEVGEAIFIFGDDLQEDLVFELQI